MSAYWERLGWIRRDSRLLEPRPGNTLNGLLTAVIPWEAAALGLYAAAAIFMLMMAARVWRSGARI